MIEARGPAGSFYCYRGCGCRPGPTEDYIPVLEVPQLPFVRGLMLYPAIKGDTERYRAKKAQLIPFSPAEAKMSERELDNHLSIVFYGIKKKTNSVGARGHRILEILNDINGYLDKNDEMLSALRTAYDRKNFFYQSPDTIRQTMEVIDVLVDTLLALESFHIQNWYKDDDPEKEIRRSDIRDYVVSQDNAELINLCDQVSMILEKRGDFWQTELATVITHEAVADLGETIGEYHDPEEVEVLP